MDPIKIIKKIIIETLSNERYWKSERAFQAEFYCNLKKRVKDLEIPEDAIFEAEYQKSEKRHKYRRRPDLIVHIPYESGLTRSRKGGNYLLFEFKVRATKSKAEYDFNKLNELFKCLDYYESYFINIDERGENNFLRDYKGDKTKIHEISVFRENNEIKVKHFNS